MKKTVTVEVPVYKCVVTYLCRGCDQSLATQQAAPPAAAAAAAPKPKTALLPPLPPNIRLRW